MIALVPTPVAACVGLRREQEQNIGAPHKETGGLEVPSFRSFQGGTFQV